MPFQNRCAPDGTLHATPARGALMGNRGGRLHRADGTLGASRWRSRAWICCLTAFRGRRRAVMGAGYTEIFFLDEPTALAAGHRPCFECRRAAALAFAAAWGRAKGTPPPRVSEMDRALHAERLGPREILAFSTIPAGVIFEADGFQLRTAAGARRWSFEGYGPERAFAAGDRFSCLTPPSIAAALRAGYAPHVSF
ncbi:MAG: hypothetical protein ABTQ27_13940 [Amaricoccus sp.]|uniref:hypothetical protein n=1 Tax=Amaricoccus sp. TaxID=1872485 RepID=UPI003314C470